MSEYRSWWEDKSFLGVVDEADQWRRGARLELERAEAAEAEVERLRGVGLRACTDLHRTGGTSGHWGTFVNCEHPACVKARAALERPEEGERNERA